MPVIPILIQLLNTLLYRDNDFDSCTIVWFIQAWGPVVVNAMLGVIMIARINAMYQGSKKLRIFLVVMLLGSTIASGVMTIIGNLGVSAPRSTRDSQSLPDEVVLSGYHMCFSDIGTYMGNLTYENVISVAVWEIFALFLTVRIVIMHFRELRQSPRRPIIGDYFTILIESHAFYFLAFAIMACLQLGTTSPNIALSSSVGSAVFTGILSISQMLQMFVLGPRLILSIREYHAKLVARADGGIGMTSLAFHAGGDALTSEDV
ncbi:uncharacterized protein F5147DRAFT_763481 [Suillus discolor]|uniref:Uncharacterized protein n=1 Tax=Suillus discolor TaxID=1912936 RepID=A0A9P7EYH1_9AGAM|nr:uncharacterized protein F5147DRAFT_763481 [Suillus discolor]KAG2097056.1 hypothetical protein F5147DRAFT_763481 [Suillus discolor]